MTARGELVTLLDAGLPDDVDVIRYAHNIDPPQQSTVMVRVDRVTPGGVGWRTYHMALTLVAAQTTYGPADDELDNLLEDVLICLSHNDIPNGVSWSEANRAAYGEPERTNPAYEVTVSVACRIESP